MILGAIDAGCHIYCEKPLAVNLRDTDEMINAADAAGVKLAVAHMARYSAAFHHARAMIERGEIGQPLAVICRGKEDGRGGGEDMMVLGTHLLDLACFFFGDPQWVMGRVRCDGRDVTKADAHEATEPMGLVAGDHVIASFGFAHGVDGQFQSRKGLADASEPRMSITIVGSKARLFFQYDSHRQLRIARSDRPMEEGGAFEVVDVKPLPEILEASPIECVAMKDTAMFRYFAKANRYAAVDLLDSIVQDRQPLASGHSARWALEMIHGVYASHLSGRLMNLPLADRDHPLESYRH
jgi:predicted dehydrogenase